MSELAVEEQVDPIRQAAILLMTIGEQEAARVLKYLDTREVQRVGEAMAELGAVPNRQINHVLDQFLDSVGEQSGLSVGAGDYLKKIMVGALGDQKATALLERIGGGSTRGLEKLRWMDARAIAEFMKDEHPQIQAIVLSYLEADQASEVMRFFDDPKECSEILMRVANLDSISPTALAELGQVLEKHAGRQTANRFAQLGGTRVAAEIMNTLDKGVDESVLEAIRETDEGLCDAIQEQMFVFDNLMAVDDRGIQTLLREVSTEMLVLALKGAEMGLQEKIFSNMSKRAAELLQDDMEAKGPVRLTEVEAAQKEILVVARKLADEGQIVLGASGEEML